MFKIRVMTTDGILEKEANVHPSVDEWEVFECTVPVYIDTEGQPFGSGGYVVQLIDDDDNIVAEETQESYISRHDNLCNCEECSGIDY